MRPGGSSSVIGLQSDQVGGLRPLFDLKSPYRLLEETVRPGDARMLTQMLEPGICEKCLDDFAFLGGILEDSPGIRAVSPPLARVARQRVEERWPVPRSASTSRVVIGAGQCIEAIDRVRFRSAASTSR